MACTWALLFLAVFVASCDQVLAQDDDSLNFEYDDYILVCNQEPIDLAFIIDASSSIWKRNFTLGLEFIMDFIDMYVVGPEDVRIAAVTFAKGVYSNGTFDFNKYDTKKETLDAIENTRYPAGLWTGTGDALYYFASKFLPHARPDIPHLCIVLTDGNSQERYKTKRAAKLTRDKGFKVFAIGVGSERQIRTSELVNIAGDETRVFRTSHYSKLSEVKKKLAYQTCYKKPKPTTPPAAQPCGVERPTDMEFIYDAASLGVDGNSFVTQFTSHTLGQEGLEQGFQLGVSSAICPEDSGFAMGTVPDALEVKHKMDGLYTADRLGKIVKQNLVKGMSAESGGRPSARKVAVVFVGGKGGKLDKDSLVEPLLAANSSMAEGMEVYFSDAGGAQGLVEDLARRFNTPPLTGSSLQQSATLHSALCE